jgi:hypothetical protein
MIEHRQHPRYAIELEAEILTAERRVAGRTDNISKGGFCMLASEPLPAQALCTVRLALVFAENQFSEHLELAARVAWCTPLGDRHQIGVKFSPLSAENLGYLTMFIKFLEEAEPG